MMPQFFHHHQIDLAQRDGLKINLTQISPESFPLLLIVDYAETTRILRRFSNVDQCVHLPVSHDKSFIFDLQLMSQMR